MSDEDDRAFADFTEWIRRNPDMWPLPERERMSKERKHELIVEAISRGRRSSPQARKKRRARRIIGGISMAAIFTGGFAIAAAGGWWTEKTKHPEITGLCHAEAAIDSDIWTLSDVEDPVTECQQLWMAEFDEPLVSKPLAFEACIGPQGLLEIFPGELGVCTTLGLARADQEETPEMRAVRELQNELVDRINAPGCVSVDDAERLATEILNLSTLEGWTVSIANDASGGDCGKATANSSNMTIVIHQL